MKKAELDQVKLVVKDAVNESVAPLHEKLNEITLTMNKHGQTLYGENGDNGMRSDVKKLKEGMEDYKQFKGKLALIGATSATVFGFAGNLVSKLFFNAK